VSTDTIIRIFWLALIIECVVFVILSDKQPF
jgi:hypothetical protein